MSIEVTSFRQFEKNTLKGFATIRMTNIGMEIRDCTVHEKDSKKWVGLPSKPYEDPDGNTKYSYIVHFYNDDIWKKFQRAALEALEPHLDKLETPPQQSDAWSRGDDIPF